MVTDVRSWKKVLVSSDESMLSAMKTLNASGLSILLVVDQENHLLGTVTDGDVRRYLLKHGDLNTTVGQVMHTSPITGSVYDSRESLLKKAQALSILHIPIVNEEKKLVGLETLKDLAGCAQRDNWVVFMAGGLGKRLHPLTLECPKPLLKIGGKPILEVLMENCIKSGFKSFYFSVNYKSEMIREYFGDGEKWGVNIQYIHESDGLGTAGSLSLLPQMPNKPFLVLNADILTNINMASILDFHVDQSNHALATICVSQYEHTVPYGVMQIDKNTHRLLSIKEKPVQTHFINSGIYVLSPEVLRHLRYNQYCDMPSFLLKLVENNFAVATFPICEYWMDIGHHENLSKAAVDCLEILEK